MAKPKSAPTPEPVKPALDTRLANELAALKRATEKAVEQREEDYYVKDIEASINALSLLRVLLKDVAEEKTTAVASLIPEATAKSIGATEAEAKRIKLEAEKLEQRLVQAIGRKVAAGEITEGVTTERGCKLVLQHRKELVIDDVLLLPKDYTKTVPDLPKIEEALKEWQTKCAACKVLKLPEPPCPVPGSRIADKVVIATKVPELIEE